MPLMHLRSVGCFFACALSVSGGEPFAIRVVDSENGWPVPMVELRTTHNSSWWTDNAGVVAIDEPDCMGREMFFHVSSDGYEAEADGFGFRGVRCVPEEGGEITVKVKRTMVAKRLGRLTGGGLFAEAGKLGMDAPGKESGVFGCDSVMVARHRGKLFWLWGDTVLPRYPLGVFDTTAAVTGLAPLKSFVPPLVLDFGYFRSQTGFPAAVADLPGEGPTWLGGLVSLPSESGDRLVATYSKIENHLDEYEVGLCEWVEENFTVKKVLWKNGDGEKGLVPRGHPVRWMDAGGKDWLLFGDPFPVLRMPASYEAWGDTARWEKVEEAADPKGRDGEVIDVHRGSVAWNAKLGKWICVFTQRGGKPSALGEIWFSRADSPFGPWAPAVKVLTHRKHTFYNPVLHPELVPEGADFILFEGTYTAEFSAGALKTPRYDYNQILYRVDLGDL